MDMQLQEQLRRIEDEIKKGQIDSVERFTRLDEQIKSMAKQLDSQNSEIKEVEERVSFLEKTQISCQEKHDSYDDLKLIDMKGTVHHHKMWIAGISAVLVPCVGMIIKLAFF